jgi:hypothetical protein
MFRLTCAFVLGIAVGLAVCWFTIYPAVAREKFEYGRMTGDQQAREAIACKIADVLGKDVHGPEPEEFFFSAKSESVMLVTRNGVKTLRFPAECTK